MEKSSLNNIVPSFFVKDSAVMLDCCADVIISMVLTVPFVICMCFGSMKTPDSVMDKEYVPLVDSIPGSSSVS